MQAEDQVVPVPSEYKPEVKPWALRNRPAHGGVDGGGGDT